uniref:Uncharacterized protein n=1 Tax=Chromera velia CCMP2878 TaxID=1169474 RepID=A0A0G4HSU0_9ALVE|eukprot:Cvel_8329.t1-p1 / transcript=Cvel_8329.t1 / gene=Cvel_8329 / organism=Chromera_velia_CCMP2878 / gene_product=hypothetical protein / transcript_product=hypothetical protein / location=Cvel_scaffold458:22578-27474(-) / protein_length=725 / sequence_SO=supercontig / SO=protein_coding / is_pseudo=false
MRGGSFASPQRSQNAVAKTTDSPVAALHFTGLPRIGRNVHSEGADGCAEESHFVDLGARAKEGTSRSVTSPLVGELHQLEDSLCSLAADLAAAQSRRSPHRGTTTALTHPDRVGERLELVRETAHHLGCEAAAVEAATEAERRARKGILRDSFTAAEHKGLNTSAVTAALGFSFLQEEAESEHHVEASRDPAESACRSGVDRRISVEAPATPAAVSREEALGTSDAVIRLLQTLCGRTGPLRTLLYTILEQQQTAGQPDSRLQPTSDLSPTKLGPAVRSQTVGVPQLFRIDSVAAVPLATSNIETSPVRPRGAHTQMFRMDSANLTGSPGQGWGCESEGRPSWLSVAGRVDDEVTLGGDDQRLVLVWLLRQLTDTEAEVRRREEEGVGVLTPSEVTQCVNCLAEVLKLKDLPLLPSPRQPHPGEESAGQGFEASPLRMDSGQIETREDCKHPQTTTIEEHTHAPQDTQGPRIIKDLPLYAEGLCPPSLLDGGAPPLSRTLRSLASLPDATPLTASGFDATSGPLFRLPPTTKALLKRNSPPKREKRHRVEHLRRLFNGSCEEVPPLVRAELRLSVSRAAWLSQAMRTRHPAVSPERADRDAGFRPFICSRDEDGQGRCESRHRTERGRGRGVQRRERGWRPTRRRVPGDEPQSRLISSRAPLFSPEDRVRRWRLVRDYTAEGVGDSRMLPDSETAQPQQLGLSQANRGQSVCSRRGKAAKCKRLT